MKPSTKNKLANTLGSNQQVNKKILNMKSSWDKVDSMLKSSSFPKKKGK